MSFLLVYNKSNSEVRYCSNTTSHLLDQHSRVRVNIYASDQAKSFESRKFTRELSKICFFSSNSAILEGFIAQLSFNAIE